jgi:NADPH-dependent curcumin reductase CurA
VLFVAKRVILPGFLGGGRRKYEFYLTSNDTTQLGRLAGWLGEGKLKAEIDEVVAFGEVPRAYEKLAEGRAKGKIVVKVAE